MQHAIYSPVARAAPSSLSAPLPHLSQSEHIQGIFSEWTLRAAATHKTYHSVLTVSHLLSFVLIIMQLLLAAFN